MKSTTTHAFVTTTHTLATHNLHNTYCRGQDDRANVQVAPRAHVMRDPSSPPLKTTNTRTHAHTHKKEFTLFTDAYTQKPFVM